MLLNEENVIAMSKDKNEPKWMLDIRLNALKEFIRRPIPKWQIPSLDEVDFNSFEFYNPKDIKARDWNDVPKDIRDVYDKMGIPEAEKKVLGGSIAQYESSSIYSSIKKEWEDKGVIFLGLDEAVEKHPDLVRAHFGKCVPFNDNKLSALHYAVWSGGSFLYVPKDVKVNQIMQTFFYMNKQREGQFEHTLIVAEKGSELHYAEGCFIKGTKVLTINGYKSIDEITTSDTVLTHNGNYKNVNYTQKRKYNGNLCEILVYGDSSYKINATENHPFLAAKRMYKNTKNSHYELEWINAKDLNVKDYLVMPINNKIETTNERIFEIEYKQKKINFSVPMNEDIFRLFGYYLSEGSVSRGHYLVFSFGSHEINLINDVKYILSKYFPNHHYSIGHHKTNHGTSVVVSSSILARFFEQFGKGSSNKQIPFWCANEKHSLQKQLVIGCFRGDGNYYRKNVKVGLKEIARINTTSFNLAYGLRDMLLRFGIVSFINSRDRSKDNRKVMHTIGITGYELNKFADIVGIKSTNVINNHKRASMFYVDDKYVYLPIKSIIRKPVKELDVYNFGVDDDESYVVGSVAVHNCTAPKYDDKALHSAVVEIFAKENSKVRYTTVQNWSKNIYNLNTKRAIVQKNAFMEWVGGSLGAKVSMLYPCSVLVGEGARASHLTITLASDGSIKEGGAKVIHAAKNTHSSIISKGVNVGSGYGVYRGLVRFAKGAVNSSSNVKCDSLMLGENSKSDTFPHVDMQETKNITFNHEAFTGKITEEQLEYAMSRGIAKNDAMMLYVQGFIKPVLSEIPLEYAIELNRFIKLQLDENVG